MNIQKEILLIDEDIELYHPICQKLIRQPDYQIVTATNGRHALELIETRQPSIMVFDLLLPGLNGFGLLRYLRQNNYLQDTAALIVSSIGYPEIIRQAIAGGASDYLVKPFDPEVLFERICQLATQPPASPSTVKAPNRTQPSLPAVLNRTLNRAGSHLQPLGTHPQFLPQAADTLRRSRSSSFNL